MIMNKAGGLLHPICSVLEKLWNMDTSQHTQADTHTGRHTHRQTHTQADTHTGRHTHTHHTRAL